MVLKCVVFECTNRKDRDKHLQFYRLPAVVVNQGEDCENLSSERRREWLASLGQKFENRNMGNIRICSAHFIGGEKARLYDKGNPNWVPTVNVGHGENVLKQTMAVNRYNRLHNRQKRKAEEKIVIVEEGLALENKENATSTTEFGTQTDLTTSMLKSMENELQALRTENQSLKEQLSKYTNKMSQVDLEGDNEKVNFFTGISSFAILISLYNFIEQHLPPRTSLDKFRMFMLTLMRLRLNLSVQFLAYEFSISPASVSRIITSVINVMYIRTKPFVFWPDRETLKMTMPMQFKQHCGSRCAVIIDCFEVFVERPSNLKARAETWSSYKHHNTANFLLGITPQGDLILADRGFNIQESVGSVCAELKIPAFTRGKSQLSAVDVETTRKIANVRIHEERVIGMVRQKYTILGSTLPINLFISKDDQGTTMVDKIAHVCCSLANLSESVVDFN
ncbi:uncharacterized protein LOC100372111 [Saccoglossus kowalevskii]|uniref:Uncharacterized protein LOC100372111 n=1 Tax=Saccoglossus kowalevskii TaxID=10224 RepID=A0ABM0LYL5_SACKO|nr:PREDICTED: uncharacterized protein LOC100372111 [Saccoglossus kowalevskii]